MRIRLTLPLLLLVLTACEDALAPLPPRTLVVESDTSWNGGVFGPEGSAWYEGRGNARYGIGATGKHCWVFEREAPGSLRVYVETESENGPERSADAEAGADGVVNECTG